jgi:GNAT superfamily N-acetyltransferase
MELADPAGLTGAQCEQLRKIYVEAFPASQRDPFTALMASVKSESTLSFTVVQEAEVVAFARLSSLSEPACFFLEYLMVSRPHRGAGIGGALLERMLSEISQRPGPQCIVFEAEDPDTAGSASEAELRLRRIRFYERHGAVRLSADDYAIPCLDGPGTESMQLLWLGDEPPHGTRLDDLIRTIYREGYYLSDEHSLLQRLRRRVLACNPTHESGMKMS